jgi:DNA-binding response OmpR family regulator
MRILLVEGDAPLSEFLQDRLAREQFLVDVINGRHAETYALNKAYDLMLLDLDLPGTNGLEVLRRIRSRKPNLPIIIITSAGNVEQGVLGLDDGADDYIAKPFAFAELAARIRAVMRRGNRIQSSVLQVDDLELDRVSHSVRRGNRAIELSPKEFLLLECLMRHEGRPISRADIVQQVWKLNMDPSTNVVDVYINYLRRKIDAGYDKTLIRTVRGIGYQIGKNDGR